MPSKLDTSLHVLGESLAYSCVVATTTEGDDPVVASYDVYVAPPVSHPNAQITDLTTTPSKVYLLQYPAHRPQHKPYSSSTHQKPTSLRIKPNTGLLELEIPIDTHSNYSHRKGTQYGTALKSSRIASQGHSHGLAGGFNTGVVPHRFRQPQADVQMRDVPPYVGTSGATVSDDEDDKGIISTQVLGGKLVQPASGDPVYMLGTFRPAENSLHLSYLDAVVQVRPQLHHLDAEDEVDRNAGRSVGQSSYTQFGRSGPERLLAADAAANTKIESKAVDVKFKSAEDSQDLNLNTNAKLMRAIQAEHWERYDWVDEAANGSVNKRAKLRYFSGSGGKSTKLESAIGNQDWLDKMSAPREVNGKKTLMAKVKGREREKARRKKNDEAKRAAQQKVVTTIGGFVAEEEPTAEESGAETTDTEAEPEHEIIDVPGAEEMEEVKEEPEPEPAPAPRRTGRQRRSRFPAETVTLDD